MEKIKNYKLIILLLAFDLLALLYGISTLSISVDEAKIYFEEKGSFLFLIIVCFIISHILELLFLDKMTLV